MTNYKVFGIGALVVSILLLIVMGHSYDMPAVYIPGWIGAAAFVARLAYLQSQRKKYTASTVTTGTNEYISGGACTDVNDYNRNRNIDESWCNFNKRESDKTNLTRSANVKFHPNTNNFCSREATKAFQDIDDKCGDIIIERNKPKKSQSQNTETSWWDDFFSSSNNYNESRYSTPPQSTYYTKPQTDYKNMSDYDLRQSANVGNQSAYKEQADRRFRDTPVNVRSDPDARPDTDFCTIM